MEISMPLFFFAIHKSTEHVSDIVELSLTDERAAKMKALTWISEMTENLPIGRHDVSVLVGKGSGCPMFRIALTLDCIGWTKVADGPQKPAPNEVAIVSSTSVLVH